MKRRGGGGERYRKKGRGGQEGGRQRGGEGEGVGSDG